MKILTYISNLNRPEKVTYRGLEVIHKYSRHEITYYGDDEINKYDYNDYDIVQIHGDMHKTHFDIIEPKVIYSPHNMILSCPTGALYCSVLNKFLEEPLTCLNCLGYVGMKTGGDNLKKYIKMAKMADVVTVDSEFMKEFYHIYDPVVLPIPLETDVFTYCDDKEDYLFYTGRLMFQKNPYGFVDIVNKTGLKGKMAVYHVLKDNAGTGEFYKEILENKNKNIEVILNPSREELAELFKHARFTILPYLYQEPYGIASADSVLCGTPLITFPYGNLRSFTKLLPKTMDEMVKMIQMNDEQYQLALKDVLMRGNELREIHEPYNAVKKWDKLYDKCN